MYRVYVPEVEGVWAPAVHANCEHNEAAAMKLRTLGPTPDDPVAFPQEVLDEFAHLRLLVKRFNLQKWSLAQTASTYTGRLRRRYEEALVSLRDEWLQPRDFKLEAFLKGEKFDPTKKVSKPRMICPRSSRYNLVLASYLKPLEHALWKHWKKGWGCRRTRVSAKGLNGAHRAALIADKFEEVGDCVCFEIDGKAFEAHITKRQLRLEHGVYKAAYGSRELADLLSCQLELKGVTAGGMKFKRDGCRASGDFNTGLGNTLLMGAFTSACVDRFFSSNPNSRVSILADGDNALIFVDRAHAAELRGSFRSIMSGLCAHEMEVENPVDVLEQTVFGQSQPVETVEGLKMVRNLHKTLAGAFCNYRHYDKKNFAVSLVHEIALAELSLNRGVPILQPYFNEVVRITRGCRRVKNAENFLEGHLIGVSVSDKTIPLTPSSRLSFERAYGLDPREQIRLEHELCAALRRDLPQVLSRGTWLKNVTEVAHGKQGESTTRLFDWSVTEAGGR
ncbi:RNA dependent RNA polymerase [Rice Tombus-like virus 2]|nr:RNA dependent RNA polymerase [Rice Tombus-like virus 2]